MTWQGICEMRVMLVRGLYNKPSVSFMRNPYPYRRCRYCNFSLGGCLEQTYVRAPLVPPTKFGKTPGPERQCCFLHDTQFYPSLRRGIIISTLILYYNIIFMLH